MPAGRPTDYKPGMFAIYVLVDPRTRKIRYAGKTNNPAKRLIAHITQKAVCRDPVNRWIASLRQEDLRPKMRVVRWVEDWESAEREVIASCRASGRPMLNIEDGGMSKKTTQKRQSKAFVTFRLCMAQMSRAANQAKRIGDTATYERRMTIIKAVRKMTDAMTDDQLERYYADIDKDFGRVRA